ncbi:MAG: hypothetical protein V3W37_08615 [Candidatus Binatia bacterium]
MDDRSTFSGRNHIYDAPSFSVMLLNQNISWFDLREVAHPGGSLIGRQLPQVHFLNLFGRWRQIDKHGYWVEESTQESRIEANRTIGYFSALLDLVPAVVASLPEGSFLEKEALHSDKSP